MSVRRSACAAAIVILTLGACSSSDSSETTRAGRSEQLDEHHTSIGDTVAAEAGFNEADVAFVEGMIPHHQQAVEMAALALTAERKAGAQVNDLAARIQAAQEPEIQLMSGWLTNWGREAETTMAGMDHSPMGDGMMTAGEMKALETATGPEFDKRWAEMMIRHHQGAIEMSKTEQASGKSEEAIALAANVIKAQELEIAEMEKLPG